VRERVQLLKTALDILLKKGTFEVDTSTAGNYTEHNAFQKNMLVITISPGKIKCNLIKKKQFEFNCRKWDWFHRCCEVQTSSVSGSEL